MDSGSSMLFPATRKGPKKQAFRNDQYETKGTACNGILVADRCELLKHDKRMTYLVNVWARSLKKVRHGAEGSTTCSLENNVKKAKLRVSTLLSTAEVSIYSDIFPFHIQHWEINNSVKYLAQKKRNICSHYKMLLTNV